MVTFNDYINALYSSSQERIIKIEWLDNNEQVIGIITPTVLDGNITIDLNKDIRRSCNLLLKNDDEFFIPSPNCHLWINSKFRLWTGLMVNGEPYYVSRGIFVVGNPEVDSSFSEKTVNIVAYDKYALLNGELAGTLESDYIIPLGTKVTDAIKAVFQAAGEIKAPIMDSTDITTPYTLTKEIGSSYADILTDLSKMISWECFYDRNGYPRFKKPTDMNKNPSVWDFKTTEVHYMGSTHIYDFSKIKNYVKVVGDNINGEIFDAVAQDTNPTSPTRIDLIGKRTLVITDDLIYTTDLAQQRADYELRKAIAMYESVNIRCVPIDIINEGDVITITDDSNGLNGDRFIVQSITFPLKNGDEMQMSVWKTREFS